MRPGPGPMQNTTVMENEGTYTPRPLVPSARVRQCRCPVACSGNCTRRVRLRLSLRSERGLRPPEYPRGVAPGLGPLLGSKFRPGCSVISSPHRVTLDSFACEPGELLSASGGGPIRAGAVSWQSLSGNGRVICVTIALSYNRGCTIAQWLRRSLLTRNPTGSIPATDTLTEKLLNKRLIRSPWPGVVDHSRCASVATPLASLTSRCVLARLSSLECELEALTAT